VGDNRRTTGGGRRESRPPFAARAMCAGVRVVAAAHTRVFCWMACARSTGARAGKWL
jgi:hypothetical protein